MVSRIKKAVRSRSVIRTDSHSDPDRTGSRSIMFCGAQRFLAALTRMWLYGLYPFTPVGYRLETLSQFLANLHFFGAQIISDQGGWSSASSPAWSPRTAPERNDISLPDLPERHSFAYEWLIPRSLRIGHKCREFEDFADFRDRANRTDSSGIIGGELLARNGQRVQGVGGFPGGGPNTVTVRGVWNSIDRAACDRRHRSGTSARTTKMLVSIARMMRASHGSQSG